MIGVNLYPDFTLQAGASKKDEAFLELFLKVRNYTKAQYVNYSIFDYQANTREMKHYLTYPMNWITHYLRNSFQDIDPLLKLDYRRVSHIDWSDLWRTSDECRFFAASCEYGVGENGLTFVTHLHDQIYGVMSLVFDEKVENWEQYRARNLALMRAQSDRISKCYKNLFTDMPVRNFHLTKREMESLYWMALGKTDAQISELMNIGRWTVSGHVKALLSKLDVPNRTAAVAKAVSLGMLVLDSTFTR